MKINLFKQLATLLVFGSLLRCPLSFAFSSSRLKIIPKNQVSPEITPEGFDGSELSRNIIETPSFYNHRISEKRSLKHSNQAPHPSEANTSESQKIIADREIHPHRLFQHLSSQILGLDQEVIGAARLNIRNKIQIKALDFSFLRNLHHDENFLLPNGIGLRGVITRDNLNLSFLNIKLAKLRRINIKNGLLYHTITAGKGGVYHVNEKTLFESFSLNNLEKNIPKGRYSFVISESGEIIIDFDIDQTTLSTTATGSHIIIGLGCPVQFAGEIEFNESGHIVNWNNRSGSYQFPDEYSNEFIQINFLNQAIKSGLPRACYNHYDEPKLICAPTELETSKTDDTSSSR